MPLNSYWKTRAIPLTLKADPEHCLTWEQLAKMRAAREEIESYRDCNTPCDCDRFDYLHDYDPEDGCRMREEEP